MTDWFKYLPQVVGSYSSTQHSTMEISLFMMLTGRERARPLTFFYPDYEGKKTSPQVYMKEAVKRQQELNEIFRRNTPTAQVRQRRKYVEKIFQLKPYAVESMSGCFIMSYLQKGRKSY